MALITTYLWIFSIITLNYKIITVSSFPLSIDGLVEYGLDLLIDNFLNGEEEQDNEPSLTDIFSKLDDIEAAVHCSEKKIIRELGHRIKSDKVMTEFNDAIFYLDSTYDTFRGLSSDSERSTLEDFAETAFTLADTGVTARLNDIMDLISPKVPRTTPLFHLLLAPYPDQEAAAARCNEPLSAQQEIHKMYGRIIDYFIKGYTMKLYAYEIFKKLNYGKFKKEKEITREKYREDVFELTRSAAAAMKLASRVIRSCDPQDGNYIQLKWLFNGLLIPNKYLKETSPYSYCDIPRGHIIGLKNDYPVKPSCDGGQVYNCTLSYMELVCMGKDSTRRYDEAGVYWKDLHHCDPHRIKHNFGPVEVFADDSDFQTYICFCLCDHKSQELLSVRKFSLNLVRSRTSENKVITGLRFVEVNRCIYIQIQEGKLEANGYIDKETVDWQEIEESSHTDQWTIEWERKTVNLFTESNPSELVLTGIGFDVRKNHLTMKYLYYEFDYKSGELYKEWDSDPDSHKRKQIEMEEPDIPTNAPSENVVTLGDQWSVDFRMTDKVKDLAQTAIPFLDSQEVISNPPRPLSAAGLYYKGQKGYGGFIALQLIAYDYAEVLAGKLLSPSEDTESSET